MVPIVSGLLAVILPLLALRGAKQMRRPYLLTVGSFFFCGVAMLEELFTIRRRLLAGDIGGIEDTIGAVLLICILLLIATVILNLFALAHSRKYDA